MKRRSNREQAGSVDVVVIGAGHSGLAMSHRLAELSIDHVVLERGEVANSWRRERWDSLRLLTPNWMSRLPGYAYDGSDPDGYMSMPEVIDFIASYAAFSGSPVLTGTTVTGVEPAIDGYRIITDRGDWYCRAVVIASGAFNKPTVPAVSAQLPDRVRQVSSAVYRRPDDLDEGGVLVVGASATGLQLADEIQRSGRPVTLAAGEHVRMPRTYRGRDIQWWLLATGVLNQGLEDVDDPTRVRRLPSPQLAGTPDHSTLDLNALTARGVRLAGRLAGARDDRVQFSGSLRNTCAMADLKMNRLLDGFDQWADAAGIATVPPERYAPTLVPESPLLELDLGRGEIRTVVWATGYRPDYSWLGLPILDRKGQLRHDGGIADLPGVYALGLPFLRRRKSSFIHGAEADVRDIAGHLAAYLDAVVPRRVAGIGL